MPIQKAGKDARAMASVVPAMSNALYCFTADSIPRAMPKIMPMAMEPAASVNVTGKRLAISEITGRPLFQELPKSPWRASRT